MGRRPRIWLAKNSIVLVKPDLPSSSFLTADTTTLQPDTMDESPQSTIIPADEERKDDWSDTIDPIERRRRQNRINQRAHRTFTNTAQHNPKLTQHRKAPAHPS
jgi:hypothetical protein